MITFILVFIQISAVALNEAPANKSLATYNPEELLLKIFHFTDTESRAGYGFANLDQEQNREYLETAERNYYNNIKFDDFNEDSAQKLNHNTPNYQQGINDVTKKRRKRRKPKQNYNGFKYSGPYYGGVPHNDYPFLAQQNHAPTLMSSALTSVTRALTSIANYDDRQCVARLLCEAAGGALSSSIFDKVSGLQPLFTLLTAYSGLSSAPLLVFGRAVLLGASSPNTASCRYAHPLCPTDTEDLVYYLNNHNGGFFRFFNAPEQEQNLGQLYNQLPQNDFHRPNQYGLYNQNLQQNNRPIPNPDTGYHQYGLAFPNNYRYGDKIEKRIQNKPIIEYSEKQNKQIRKLVFPEDDSTNRYYSVRDYISNNDFNYIKSDEFKFPDSDLVQENFRKIRGFSFPESNTDYNYQTEHNERFIFGNYNKPAYDRLAYKNILNEDQDVSKVQTVYVVRGNGDPNKPEIIHLRPGQTLQK